MITGYPYTKKFPTELCGSARINKARRDEERRRTEAIMDEAELRKERAKEEMFIKRKEDRQFKKDYQAGDSTCWDQRMLTSPFRVNLLAEEERIHEEYFVRLKEEELRKRLIERRKEKAKADIIIKVSFFFNHSQFVNICHL